LRVYVKTKSPFDKFERRVGPDYERIIISSAKQASDPAGPQATQHIAKRNGFPERGAQAATQAVHAPGGLGPD
jgi:hypothetical protein